PGPYTKEWREHWLRRVLEAQQSARENGPEEFRGLTLITEDELHEIRRIWLYEKHEFDDSLPRVYEEVAGEKFPKRGDEGNGLRDEPRYGGRLVAEAGCRGMWAGTPSQHSRGRGGRG